MVLRDCWDWEDISLKKSSITPIYSSSLICMCKWELLLWVCSNLLLILLCCVAKLAQNWFMKENTKQLALCFCLRPDHSTLLDLLNALQSSRLSVFNMEGPIHLLANFVSKTVGGVAGVLFSATMTISRNCCMEEWGWQELQNTAKNMVSIICLPRTGLRPNTQATLLGSRRNKC